MTLRCVAVVVFLLLAPLTGLSRAGGIPPALEIEAPPALAGTATELRERPAGELGSVARLMGIEAQGPPIHVVLAPESSDLAREAPSWYSGYAVGDRGLIVLFPARALSYPDATLPDLLRHEVAHVLAARAAGFRPLPRWFDEGLAMQAGNTWGLDERSRLALALLVEGRLPLDDLDRQFTGGQGEVGRAYAIAGAFVHDLVERHGQRIAADVLSGIAHGLPFDAAFENATGTTVESAYAEFWSGRALERWLPVLTSSLTLWLAITFLALWAIRRRRQSDAARRALWDEEERLQPPSPEAPGDMPF